LTTYPANRTFRSYLSGGQQIPYTYYVKIYFTLQQAMKAQTWCRSMVLLFLKPRH